MDLAKKLPRQSDTFTALSGLLTFTDKLIDKDYAQRLKEECFMLTQVERLIYEDCWERAMKKAQEQVEEQVQKRVQKQSLDKSALLLAKTGQELNFTKEYALQHLTEVTGATRQEALKYLNQYWRS